MCGQMRCLCADFWLPPPPTQIHYIKFIMKRARAALYIHWGWCRTARRSTRTFYRWARYRFLMRTDVRCHEKDAFHINIYMKLSTSIICKAQKLCLCVCVCIIICKFVVLTHTHTQQTRIYRDYAAWIKLPNNKGAPLDVCSKFAVFLSHYLSFRLCLSV